LEVIAAFFVALIMAVKIINKLRGIPSRIIMSNTVCFQPDRIVIEKRCIEMQSIRVIDATMAYKDGPAYGSAKYLSDGTNNVMRVIYHDSREDTINFYLEFSSQLKMLEQILREGKQRHGFTLIM